MTPLRQCPVRLGFIMKNPIIIAFDWLIWCSSLCGSRPLSLQWCYSQKSSSSELSSAYLGLSLTVLRLRLFIFTRSHRGMVDSISASSSGGRSFSTDGSIPPVHRDLRSTCIAYRTHRVWNPLLYIINCNWD